MQSGLACGLAKAVSDQAHWANNHQGEKKRAIGKGEGVAVDDRIVYFTRALSNA